MLMSGAIYSVTSSSLKNHFYVSLQSIHYKVPAASSLALLITFARTILINYVFSFFSPFSELDHNKSPWMQTLQSTLFHVAFITIYQNNLISLVASK